MKTLSIDIGGSKLKAAVLNENGEIINDYVKIKTPAQADPQNIIAAIKTLVKDFEFDRVAAGFPGYVRDGVVHTAPNLDNDSWAMVDLDKMLTEELGKPAKVANDADVLGLGIISGQGFEMVVTLGTGFGTALYKNGKLLPHLEISHHPIADGKDYDQYIGKKVLKEIGEEEWLKRIKFILPVIKTVINYDTLYIGGGNAKLINFPLDENVKIVTNLDGIDGGYKLWEADE